MLLLLLLLVRSCSIIVILFAIHGVSGGVLVVVDVVHITLCYCAQGGYMGRDG